MTDNTQRVQVIVEGSARVAERDREAYLELVRGVVAAAAKKRGCLKFVVAEDIVERNLFHLTELGADMECLNASRFSEANVAVLQKLGALDVRDRHVLIHQVSGAESG